MAEPKEELYLELTDDQWPFTGTDHDRLIVRAIVTDGAGGFWFVRVHRDDDFGKATLIETSGGGVEAGETLEAAIRRELREELGAEVDILGKLGVVSDYYNLIRRHNINHYFLCRALSFGETHRTADEIRDFHLSTLHLGYDEAVREYETRACTPLGRLIARRELPILRRAREVLTPDDRDPDEVPALLGELDALLRRCEAGPDEALLRQEPWLAILCNTEHRLVNLERVERVESLSGRETLEYVLRSLRRVRRAALARGLTAEQLRPLIRTLQWSETAKGGTAAQRTAWEAAGLELSIHNMASAEIYRSLTMDEPELAETVACLIRTHGLLGQAMRGEIPLRANAPLRELLPTFREQALTALVLALNDCLVGAVSEELWNGLLPEAEALVPAILRDEIREYPTEVRLRRLCPWFHDVPREVLDLFENRVFPRYELWYFPSAFRGFSAAETGQILTLVLEASGADSAVHLNFHPLSATMFYDYEGRRHINVYRLRVIQKFLRERSNENVRFQAEARGSALYVDFRFHPACEKLVDFCVAAERSGLLDYEKAITILLDVFGFRLDAFDRLNNEDKYLSTMNDAEQSTKASIADYVTGGSVVDVGSGGGVMLDLLERKLPEARIIGTDISDNVIEYLNRKRTAEGRRWTVLRHNFVEGPLPFPVDTVVFSSILHEIYSYTEGPKGKFDPDSVRLALRNAWDSLAPGGRLVIRDGVKTEGRGQVLLTFLDPEGMPFFENYRRDFRGLADLPEEEKAQKTSPTAVRGDVNYIREFLYTYTWGRESYAHEVQEQFGYMTLRELCACLEDLGMKIRRASQFLEPGYPEHLLPKVRLTDLSGNPLPLPDSNLIVVAEK